MPWALVEVKKFLSLKWTDGAERGKYTDGCSQACAGISPSPSDRYLKNVRDGNKS